MKNNVDFVNGEILRPLIWFTIPIFFTMLLQLLYGAVDVFIVGRFCEASSVSAISTGSQLVITLIFVSGDLIMGTAILLGQKLGANDEKAAGKVLGSTIFLFGIMGLVITIFLPIFARQFAMLMNAPYEALDETILYARISGLGGVFLVAFNAFGGIFRGIGDSKTPLMAVGISTIINILGDLILVGYYGKGAAGAAVATVFAQGISVIISLYVVRKKGFPFAFNKKDIRFNKVYIMDILRLGIPLALQSGLVNMSFLVIIAIINNLGVLASAGVGITERLCTFLMLIQISFSRSVATFTAYNAGAYKYDRAKKAMIYGALISLGFSVIIASFSFFKGDILVGLFTKDPLVIEAGWEYLKSYSIDVVFTGFLFCFIGHLNGLGRTKFTMIQGIAGAFAIRIPFSYGMSILMPESLFLIGLATPMATFFQCGLCLYYIVRMNKKIKKGIPSL